MLFCSPETCVTQVTYKKIPKNKTATNATSADNETDNATASDETSEEETKEETKEETYGRKRERKGSGR